MSGASDQEFRSKFLASIRQDLHIELFVSAVESAVSYVQGLRSLLACLLRDGMGSLWNGEFADANGMRIAIDHIDGKHYVHGSSEKFLRTMGKVSGHHIEMLNLQGRGSARTKWQLALAKWPDDRPYFLRPI